MARSLALVVCLVGMSLLGGPAISSETQQSSVSFVYDDLDRFTAALTQVDAGADPEASFTAYIRNGSPVFPFFAERYGATGESLAKEVAKRPRHYHRVAELKPYLQSIEPTLVAGVARLQELMPGVRTPPIYFLVGNLTAGGIHAKLEPVVDGHETAPAVLLETVSMTDETDMSEFPGAYTGAYRSDIPYVVVHEMVHAYQARLMGIENYVSIFKPGPSNVYLVNAVREGCADYVTYLATGMRRTGNQHTYGSRHEVELWSQFQAVKDKPLSFADGWFGASDAKTPEWPTQIGYWLGSRICETYHQSAANKAQAMRDIFNAYTLEDAQKIAAPYARKFPRLEGT